MILFGGTALPYHRVMDGMTLPPELERFAEDAIAAGHYRDLAELVAAGLSLLQRQEQVRLAFIATLEDAEVEADRDGWHSADDVHAEMATLVNEARRAKV